MPRARTTGIVGEENCIEVLDTNGNVVRIPVPQLTPPDPSIPQKDNDGTVPEFVNASGKVQQHSLGAPYEGKTIVVPPWGILKGAQFRYFSEPVRTWGDGFPPYIERERNNGEYDNEYLLTEKQVMDHIKKIESWEFGPKYLRLMRDNAKIQEYNSVGQPKREAIEIQEDRSKINATIARKIEELETAGKRVWALMTGSAMPRTTR